MKRSTDFLRIITVFISALSVLITIVITIFTYRNSGQGTELATQLEVAILMTLVATVISFASQLITSQLSNPSSLTITLLGYPNSGKTVYLTVLFNELATKRFSGFIFSPYGSETIEKVADNLNLLMQKQWPSTTSPDSLFFYRANATTIDGSGLFKKKYKLEIGDYAGEYFETLSNNPDETKWLHKTGYFKYVVQSDIVLLTIDSSILLNHLVDNKSKIVENGMLAAMQLLVSEKGVEVSKKMKAPVALLLMKADLVTHEQLSRLENKLSRLITYCQTHCYDFKVFWVSSIGYTVSDDNSLLGEMEPDGVAEPLLWAIKRA